MKLAMCTNWPSKALTLEENIKLKSTLLYSPILFYKIKFKDKYIFYVMYALILVLI